MNLFVLISFMFDITNKRIRETKLKYAEFLLIVGGIIGSLGLKFSTPDSPALYSLLNRIFGSLGFDAVNTLANMVFVIFLIGTISYYSILSNRQYNRLDLHVEFNKRRLIIFATSLITSIGFSTVIIFQFKSINLWTDITSGFLFLLLFWIIFVSLFK